MASGIPAACDIRVLSPLLWGEGKGEGEFKSMHFSTRDAGFGFASHCQRSGGWGGIILVIVFVLVLGIRVYPVHPWLKRLSLPEGQ